jgi:hypothetical protein
LLRVSATLGCPKATIVIKRRDLGDRRHFEQLGFSAFSNIRTRVKGNRMPACRTQWCPLRTSSPICPLLPQSFLCVTSFGCWRVQAQGEGRADVTSARLRELNRSLQGDSGRDYGDTSRGHSRTVSYLNGSRCVARLF